MVEVILSPLCSSHIGDESSLPPYLRRLTGKHVSEIIRDHIITSQVRNTEYYDVTVSHYLTLYSRPPKRGITYQNIRI